MGIRVSRGCAYIFVAHVILLVTCTEINHVNHTINHMDQSIIHALRMHGIEKRVDSKMFNISQTELRDKYNDYMRVMKRQHGNAHELLTIPAAITRDIVTYAIDDKNYTTHAHVAIARVKNHCNVIKATLKMFASNVTVTMNDARLASTLANAQWLDVDVTRMLRDNIRVTFGENVQTVYLNVIASCRTRVRRVARKKRLGRTQCYKTDQKRCCRHALTVTFADYDTFDFVISPATFDIGYCRGRCPYNYNLAHKHALLQSLVWKRDHAAAPKPCCAPSKLQDLDVLHVDQDNPDKLKITKWHKMGVVDCACS